MAKVFIPQVGDKIELSQNWNCKIFNERRNSSVFESLGVDVSQQKNSNIDITFPKGTIFKVTRLYVRAPASSYDSLTLAVVSSPIKKLAKAKFWVKIMDANNMEFDSTEMTFNDFDSISSLFRHIVLNEGYASDRLSMKDRQPFLSQIISHFSNPENTISFEAKVDKDTIFSTYVLREEFRSWRTKAENSAYEQEVETLLKELPEEITVKVTIYPALQGVLFKIDTVDSIKSIDDKLNYTNEFKGYYKNQRLGSYLSDGYSYSIDNLKENQVTFLQQALEQGVDFNVGGKVQKIKNLREFNKIIATLM